jgi:hypothetical protein
MALAIVTRLRALEPYGPRLCGLGLALFLAVWPGSTGAAPPKLDYLFPAGAARGSTVTVTAGGAIDKWPVQVWCDRSDLTLAAATDKGKLTATIPAEASPGTCWIRLFDGEGSSSLRPFIVGLIPETVEVEPNNEPAKAQSIADLPVTVNGRFEQAGDADVFAVSLKQGQVLVASMEANCTLESPLDGVLQIVSPAGFILDHNDDDHGLDPQIAFQVPADGTYFVRAMAFPATPDSSIRLAGGANYVYRLTLATSGFVDHFWPMAVAGTGSTEVNVLGWNIPAEAARLPIPDPAGLPGVAPVAPGLVNVITIPVEPHTVVDEAQPGGPREPQDVPVPATITGRLDQPREVDAYRVTLKKGEVLRIDSTAREVGSPLDVVLKVLDNSGKILQQVDDVQEKRDAELTWTAPDDGAYLITIADLNRGGGWRFVYRLTLTHPQPDFQATVATDHFVLTPGKPLEIPVTIARTKDFAEEIEVAITGLPAGALVEPARSEAKGESAKSVKLTVTGMPEPTAGLVRITATAKGDSKLTRQAQGAIAGMKARTADLWLTVAAPAAQK